jgi:hypothetical protein
MASENQGRGKSAFREFKRELRATANDIKASFASGFTLSPLDIQNIYDLVFTNYVRTIDEADLPNPQIWINRGQLATDKAEDDTLRRANLERSNPFIIPEGGDFLYEVEDEETGVLTTKSIPIISGSDRLAKAGIVVRKRLIPPEEIEEYVSAVPYPIGIQPVYENGILKGFRLWVQK